MEPPFFGGGNPGGEALRWISIAEKLLSSRDLMGSKSFASRAREADPQLIASYQILAIVDTLMASDKRINNHLDWYFVLQLQPTDDSESIATQYRRLAILLNPQKNHLPFADQAFRLVVEAWSVLSNVSRKRVYDAEVGFHSHPPVSPLVTLDLTGQSMFGQNSPVLPQVQEFQFRNNNGGDGNNIASGSPIMRGFMGMGSSSGGQMGNAGDIASQNVSGPGEEDRMGNVGGYTGNNVWVSRDEGRGERGNVGNDTNNDIGANTTGNVPIGEAGVEDVAEDNGSDEHEPVLGEDDGMGGTDEVEGTFWTACPYCYHLFEYPKVYVDCTMRCQKCSKAFHGVKIPSPPPIVEGEETYFCCWGYMPLAVSVRDLGSSGGGASNWTPFSPMFTCPQKPGNIGGPTSYDGPRFCHDNDDVYVEVSDSSEGSDDDWRTSEKKKKTKNVKRKRASATVPGKTMKKQHLGKTKNVNGGTAETTIRGSVIQGSVNGMVAESSSKGPASNTRRQSGRVANGKLDLNVEFSNETEDQVSRISLANGAGHGSEDNFEGTYFFEGLDEFLSSLPILTGVGDDRVKAA